MAVRELAERVILQSIEDLWDKQQHDACSNFFCGQGFLFWADAAGMTNAERRKMLSLIVKSITGPGSFTEDIWA